VEYRKWLETLLESGQIFGISDLVLSGFLRVVTHPRIFNPPTPLFEAWRFVDALRQEPQCIPISPGPRHWEIFKELTKSVEAKGNVIADAYHAALAIENGAEWITTDRDFARFPKLKWRHPLENKSR
jgi:toxin-antitoxin system PIN domain toxin